MIEGETIWRVHGNMDQITRVGLDKDYAWIAKHPNNNELRNRVVAEFEDKMQACDLYNKMRSLKIVAARNWLD